jgi:energy-coupling factor transporter ATP-binding protein EcfA2
MIQLNNITKIFNQGRPNEFTALEGVSLSVEAKRLTVFKGPSGSGKTTLLSLIGCMSRPTAGRIEVFGMDPRRDGVTIRSRLAYVPGELRLPDRMTGAELAGSLFSESARYYETPFSEPFVGPSGIKEYWSRVTAVQGDIGFNFELLATDAQRAWAHWTAEFNVMPTGEHVKLDGIFQLTFDEDFRCSELREWWHVQTVPAAGPAGKD